MHTHMPQASTALVSVHPTSLPMPIPAVVAIGKRERCAAPPTGTGCSCACMPGRISGWDQVHTCCRRRMAPICPPLRALPPLSRHAPYHASVVQDMHDMAPETGTYQWMAPEVIRHEAYDKRCDVYSYAILAWEMLTDQ